MKKTILMAAMFALTINSKTYAQDGSQYLGQLAWVTFNYTPAGWLPCNGQLLPIAQYSALFSLLGTQYGGNGSSNFALPDLQGRTIIGSGSGPGLTSYVNGEKSGQATVTLDTSQLPAHNHTVNAVTLAGNQNLPGGNLPANTGAADTEYSTGAADTNMSPLMIQPVGQSQPHDNMQPYIGMKCIIATQGVYPQRP